MAKAEANILEIEVAGPCNENLLFRPLQRKVRGRFDVQVAMKHDSGAAALLNEWPTPIPGQRIGVNVATGEGYISEPLHEPEHAAYREKIERSGMGLEPERQTFTVDVPTWTYWLKDAVIAGLATVTVGTLPDEIQGKPQKLFYSEEQTNPIDRLAAAMEKQNESFAALLKLLAEANTRR